MSLPVGELPPTSYWGRFVPASIGLVLLTLVVLPLPLLNIVGVVGIPTVLLVLLQERPEPSMQRWLPALAVAVLLGMVDPVGGLMALSLALVAILLDREIRRGRNWGFAGLAGSAPFLLMAVLSLPNSLKDREAIREQVEFFFTATMEQLSQMGFSLAQTEEQLIEFVDIGVKIWLLIPAGLTVLGLFVGFGALICGMWWLRRRERVQAVEIPPFTIWVMPEKLVWGAVAGLALLVVGPGNWHTAGMNLVVVLAMIYSVQGLAIMWYGFEVRGTPNWVRVLFMLVLTFLHVIGIGMMAVLGLLETWVPLRSLMARSAEEGKEEDM